MELNMSDTMLLGVLRMPMDLWNDESHIDKVQRCSRYIQAANKIEALSAALYRCIQEYNISDDIMEEALESLDI